MLWDYLKSTLLVAVSKDYSKNTLLIAVSKNYLKNTLLVTMRLFKEYILDCCK